MAKIKGLLFGMVGALVLVYAGTWILQQFEFGQKLVKNIFAAKV